MNLVSPRSSPALGNFQISQSLIDALARFEAQANALVRDERLAFLRAEEAKVSDYLRTLHRFPPIVGAYTSHPTLGATARTLQGQLNSEITRARQYLDSLRPLFAQYGQGPRYGYTTGVGVVNL